MGFSSSETQYQSGGDGTNAVLAAALDYLRRGWSVVPVEDGKKRPAGFWKKYQADRADEEQLRRWFDPSCGGRFTNLAIVCGPVSGRLCVRDFDDGDNYDIWAEEYPEYARSLPTVKTSRGVHVYIRNFSDSTFTKTLKFTDGELRYEGAIVVAPPSLHPEGVQYQWLIPPPVGDIPEIDPTEIGLVDISNPQSPVDVRSSTADGFNLSSRTWRFLSKGAHEGERNSELFAAACDMAGAGITQAIAETQLRPAAVRSGLPEDEVRDTVSSAYQKERKPARELMRASQSSQDALPLIDHVSNRDHVNDLFGRIVESVRRANQFFNLNARLVYLRPGVPPVRVTEANLNGLLSSLLEIAVYRAGAKGRAFQKYALLPGELVGPFTTSPRVVNLFPTLKQYTRAPVFDCDWNFVATPGYHPASGIYYDGPNITPIESTELLKRVLADFCWKVTVDRVNYIGMLLTTLTMPHWLMGHPLVTFNGNKPGVGKSLLAKVLAIVVDGCLPGTVSFNPNDEEFEKSLATRVEAGDRIIIIDNAKGNRRVRMVESQILERAVTDPILNFRRLGSNSSISRENDVIFCLTMNYTQMGRDLRRRNVPVNLELNANPRDAEYSIDRMEAFVIENRVALVAELAGMVMRWRQVGRHSIDNPAKHSVNQVWAETIDGILRANSQLGFLSNFDESEHAFDPEYALIVEICERFHQQPKVTASEWAKRLAGDILGLRLADRSGAPKSPRSQATIVGNLFSPYLDTEIETDFGRFTLVCDKQGSAHSSGLYGFVPVRQREEGVTS